MRGIITTVQRMSIHDGPGLRSTVFMKGCNLRCKWCHNPETWSRNRQLQYIASRCVHCHTCVAACPQNIIIGTDDGISVDRKKCDLCGECVDRCLTDALSFVGRDVTVAELMEELLSDRIFYETSGGGITVSGGEPLIQADFCLELLKACRKEKIHTAVESNMTADWKTIAEIADYADLWMCDLKMYDSGKHRMWTGVGNERIVENISRLAETGAEMIVRTPVIPEVNDSPEEIRKICTLLKSLGGNVRYELLGFHSLGFGKFENLGMKNPIPSMKDYGKSGLQKLKDIVKEYNLDEVK